MENEQTFDIGIRSKTGGGADNADGDGTEQRIAAAIGELEQVHIKVMSRSRADSALGLLGRLQAMTASLICDVTRVVSVSDSDTDPVEVLRQGARLSGRDAQRMTKVARHLSDMPNVVERLAAGDITLGHAEALVDAAEKVGPEAVEGDGALFESADTKRPDAFRRRARDWSNRKLIEAGVDILERQRRAREAKVWVEKGSGMGMLFAKLPASRFGHVRQAVDTRYMYLLRRDGADGRDPDEVRTPKQRLADVLFELLTNRDPDTGDFLTEDVDMRAKASTQLVITAEKGVIDGTNPRGRCEIIGVGPAPRQILRTLSPDTELCGMVFDRAGRVLWLGRKQALGERRPTPHRSDTGWGMLRVWSAHAPL